MAKLRVWPDFEKETVEFSSATSGRFPGLRYGIVDCVAVGLEKQFVEVERYRQLPVVAKDKQQACQ